MSPLSIASATRRPTAAPNLYPSPEQAETTKARQAPRPRARRRHSGRCPLPGTERVISALQPLPILFRLVARLARDAHEAARIVVDAAEVGLDFVPRRIGFRDRPAIAGRGDIGAANDAMVVAEGGERVGNRPLLEKRYGMAPLRQGPGAAKAGNAGADDDDLPAISQRSGADRSCPSCRRRPNCCRQMPFAAGDNPREAALCGTSIPLRQ